ncbi:MAG: M20 family metallopeptidase [Acidimicrobiales bacterium]|nr:M20 family metallopeptidase [Acidimicrobiales bacterium]
MDLAEAKARLCAEVETRADLLIDVSHQIHARPELGYEEHFAHRLLTEVLEREGLAVERSAYGIETAFVARAGTNGPTVAVLCEYDALPGIGHACGHNVIAAAGLGAGIATAALSSQLGGRVVVIGTPAEEGGGGKVKLLEQGAFEGIDAALMIHPAGADLRRMNAIAVQQLWVEYHGQEAHAAAAPHRGRNALDAAVLGYVNVAALRQHIRPDERIHGIFTHAGDQPNIVPKFAAAQWYVRSPDLSRLEQLKPRVLACLQAGADAAGCRMTYEWKEPVYADLRSNEPLLDLYSENAGRLGRDVVEPSDLNAVVGSTDMGNVSYHLPAIHPMIAVSPPDVAIHTAAFAEYAAGPAGDQAVLDGARAMAMTIADLWMRPDTREAVREAFREG